MMRGMMIGVVRRVINGEGAPRLTDSTSLSLPRASPNERSSSLPRLPPPGADRHSPRPTLGRESRPRPRPLSRGGGGYPYPAALAPVRARDAVGAATGGGRGVRIGPAEGGGLCSADSARPRGGLEPAAGPRGSEPDCAEAPAARPRSAGGPPRRSAASKLSDADSSSMALWNWSKADSTRFSCPLSCRGRRFGPRPSIWAIRGSLPRPSF